MFLLMSFQLHMYFEIRRLIEFELDQVTKVSNSTLNWAIPVFINFIFRSYIGIVCIPLAHLFVLCPAFGSCFICVNKEPHITTFFSTFVFIWTCVHALMYIISGELCIYLDMCSCLHVYISGEYYYRLNHQGIDSGYPRMIEWDWGTVKGPIDAALTWPNGWTFIFKVCCINQWLSGQIE